MRLLVLIGIIALNAKLSVNAYSEASSLMRAANASFKFISEAERRFSAEHFGAMTTYYPHSAVYTPLGVFILMSMLCFGARGNTRNQLVRTLGIAGENKRISELFPPGFRILMSSLSLHEDDGLHILNNIFIPDKVALTSKFAYVAENLFLTNVERVHIDDRYVNDGISPDSNFVIFNVLRFKGVLESGFNPANTKLQPFHIHGSKVPTDIMTMYTYGRYRYGELPQHNARFVELPYKCKMQNECMSLFIILPDQRTGYSKLLNKIKHVTAEELSNSSMANVHLWLPKMKIETRISLAVLLGEDARLRKLFKSRSVFSGLLRNTSVTSETVSQIVSFEVNEDGCSNNEVNHTDHGNQRPQVPSEAISVVSSNKLSYKLEPSTTIHFKAEHPFFATIAFTGKNKMVLLRSIFQGLPSLLEDQPVWPTE